MIDQGKKNIFLFAGGLFVGIVILFTLRVQYYIFIGLQPNMHPGIAFFFMPIIFPFIFLFSLLVESLFARFGYKTHTKLQTFFVGFLYASLLLWWAFPEHIFIFIFINPIVLRLMVNHYFKPGNGVEQTPSM